LDRLFITHIGALALPDPARTGVLNLPVDVIHDTWLEIEDGRVKQIGAAGEPKPPDSTAAALRYHAGGRLATPGFVDAHTHPVFISWRSGEFLRRIRGETYQQIAAAGGGILSSVRGVRSATVEQLAELVRKRLDRFLELGTTTIEAKSGYGLTVEDELKSLRALHTAAAAHPVEVSPTLLGAHTIPPEHRHNPDEYTTLVCDRMIPAAAAARLADAVDVFLEEGAFTLPQARRVFEAGRKAGLSLRIHADQFTSGGGAALAAEFGALSADHMDHTDEAGLKLLAQAGVTVVLLPGAVFFLGLNDYAPARRMLDNNCRIALATDFNPGSCPTQSLPLMMTLACIKMKLTPAEALWAATMGGAYALGANDRIGTLKPGYQADICLWVADDADFIPYSFGNASPEAVFKRGKLVYRRSSAPTADLIQ